MTSASKGTQRSRVKNSRICDTQFLPGNWHFCHLPVGPSRGVYVKTGKCKQILLHEQQFYILSSTPSLKYILGSLYYYYANIHLTLVNDYLL